MKQSVLSYTFKGLTSSTKNKVRKQLLGHVDTQKQGKYKYVQKGLLDYIPHKKLQRGVILINSSDEEKLSELFKMHEVKYEIYQISPMV